MTKDNEASITYLSSWKTEYRCINCTSTVSFNTRMNSMGRCPHCGHKDSQSCTVMRVTEHAYRLARKGKWWQFWITPIRIYNN